LKYDKLLLYVYIARGLRIRIDRKKTQEWKAEGAEMLEVYLHWNYFHLKSNEAEYLILQVYRLGWTMLLLHLPLRAYYYYY
jgi:hypothetical protein